MKYYCPKCQSIFEPGVLKMISGVYGCPMCKKEMQIIPYYETPEQYEKRTGKPVSDDMAVWVKGEKWTICQYFHLHISVKQGFCIIVIADPPFPPPENWKPEETDNE
jgi:hypothetical protein